MYFDLFLISVLMVAGYLGPTIIRRHPPGERGFGWLLVADGLCALIALVQRQRDGGTFADLLGFIALAAAFFLLVVPPLLRDITHRAMGSGRLGLVRFLLGLRELLQPGMGAREERELIDTLVSVRARGLDAEIDLLEQARANMSDEHRRRAVDERIVFTYISARRWREALDAYERSLTPETTTPQLLIEIMRSYCEVDELEKAALLMRVIEGAAWAQEPAALPLIARARMVFLAFAGRSADVERLLATDGPLGGMPAVSRYFWLGVARLHGGDAVGARAQFTALLEALENDPITAEYARDALEAADRAEVEGPRVLPDAVAELADLLAERVATMGSAPVQRVPRMDRVAARDVPVTAVLCAVELLVFALVLVGFGSTGDPGALVRAGANVKSAVWMGEWWRLCTSMFLHVGFMHLLLNVYGLWLLGKLVEQVYGSARMFAIFTVTGLAGSLASAVFGGPAMSVGASGAIMGLLGALIGDLMVARSAYPEAWRKSLLGRSIFVAGAMVAIGLFYEAIDQSAHVGGLVMGLLLGVVLSPNSFLSRLGFTRALGRVLVVASALVLLYSAFSVAGASYRDTLARYPTVEYRVPVGLAFEGPVVWRLEGRDQVIDPFAFTVLGFKVEAGTADDVGQVLEVMRAREEGAVVGAARIPEHEHLALPEPWQSRELMYVRDGMGGEQTFRVIFTGRAADREMWLVTVFIPEALADDLQPTIEQMLRSMHRL